MGIIPNDVDFLTTVAVLSCLLMGLLGMGFLLAQLVIKGMRAISAECLVRYRTARFQREPRQESRYKRLDTPTYLRRLQAGS
ncbi:hypothetical protein DFO67_11554 [Modicisalibacter xianhensis]|uniref:Uncharacterized protein n=1 Tax=Modicisalibacter xianhensis TaxID=442341 RepID=A0A4R8FKP3_9GAMM|nr:hypothetical protein [Halomonas xianhensis]TDX26789.1 hypothetical protein DFO67_11554 [Halomonas xianhensis]